VYTGLKREPLHDCGSSASADVLFSLVSAEEARSCAGRQDTRERRDNELAQRRGALKGRVVIRPQRMHLSLLWREHSTGALVGSNENNSGNFVMDTAIEDITIEK
jgi:hypothetical protein